MTNIELKKILLISSVSVIAAFGLSACGDDKASAPAAVEETTEEAAPSAMDEAGGVTEEAKEKAGEMIEKGKEKAGEMIDEAKDKAGETVDKAKQDAIDEAKKKAEEELKKKIP